MELPEVGSKWVAKVDNPSGAGVDKGDVVGVIYTDKALVYCTDGWCFSTSQWYRYFEPYQEDKREFQVGDMVKCLHPTIVCSDFEGEVGTVTHLIGLDLEDGQQVVEIKFPDGCSQRAYVNLDGVVLAEEVETKKPPTESTAGGYTPKDIKEMFESMSEDNVNSPSHYGQGDIEAIEYIKDFLTKEEYIGYLRGNIAKYLHRWRYKNGVEDLKKARVYLDWLIGEMK